MLFLPPLAYYKFLRGRYPNTYLAEDQFQVIIGIDCEAKSSLDFDYQGLKSYYQQKSLQKIAPFAGLFGVFSYNSIHFFEHIEPEQKQQNYFFPDFYFCDAKAYLHFEKSSKIYNFYGDFDKYFEQLIDLPAEPPTKKTPSASDNYKIISDLNQERIHFEKIFAEAQKYLARGDLFQVVLSEQLEVETGLDGLDFYQQLTAANPSPYMYFFPTPYGDIVGSSPELVVLLQEDKITIEPIAGTRGRGTTPDLDKALADELLTDAKELSEHRMLVDLARNDIGKFAEPGSVKVESLTQVVYFEKVMHLVSKVVGKKLCQVSIFELIAGVFPAGTLSGTPKIRALEVINELEEFKRNIYGGALGFLHYNGDLQLIILIRSALFKKLSKNSDKSRVFIQAGAGIVADSKAHLEYQEIEHKRASLLNAFDQS